VSHHGSAHSSTAAKTTNMTAAKTTAASEATDVNTAAAKTPAASEATAGTVSHSGRASAQCCNRR
jgi:hypothetical protein